MKKTHVRLASLGDEALVELAALDLALGDDDARVGLQTLTLDDGHGLLDRLTVLVVVLRMFEDVAEEEAIPEQAERRATLERLEPDSRRGLVRLGEVLWGRTPR